MAAAEKKLIVFAHLDTDWVPCGQLTLIEDGPMVLASRYCHTSVIRCDNRELFGRMVYNILLTSSSA